VLLPCQGPEGHRKEWQAKKGQQLGLIAVWHNAAALETASYAGKREVLATLRIRAVVYGRDDYKIVAPPATNAHIAIGNS